MLSAFERQIWFDHYIGLRDVDLDHVQFHCVHHTTKQLLELIKQADPARRTKIGYADQGVSNRLDLIRILFGFITDPARRWFLQHNCRFFHRLARMLYKWHEQGIFPNNEAKQCLQVFYRDPSLRKHIRWDANRGVATAASLFESHELSVPQPGCSCFPNDSADRENALLFDVTVSEPSTCASCERQFACVRCKCMLTREFLLSCPTCQRWSCFECVGNPRSDRPCTPWHNNAKTTTQVSPLAQAKAILARSTRSTLTPSVLGSDELGFDVKHTYTTTFETDIRQGKLPSFYLAEAYYKNDRTLGPYEN